MCFFLWLPTSYFTRKGSSSRLCMVRRSREAKTVVCQFGGLSVCLFACLFVCLFVCLSVCLFACVCAFDPLLYRVLSPCCSLPRPCKLRLCHFGPSVIRFGQDPRWWCKRAAEQVTSFTAKGPAELHARLPCPRVWLNRNVGLLGVGTPSHKGF